MITNFWFFPKKSVWDYSRKKLAKEIAWRNAKRIEKHTVVSRAFRPEEIKPYKDNVDSIARFAEKNNCKLEFTPSFKKLGTPKMKVYDTGYRDVPYGNGTTYPEWFEKYRGEIFLPKEIATKDKKGVMETIKAHVAKVLYGDKK